VFEDQRARERLSQPLDMVNIQDYSVPELLSFIFNDHNLFYDYDAAQGVVRVSYTKTVNFNVDYINMSELKTETVKSISVGAGGSSTGSSAGGSSGSSASSSGSSSGGSGNSGTNNDLTTVTATATFTFWEQLQSQLQQILQVDDEYNDALNKIMVNRDAAVLTVTGTKRQTEEVKRYLDKLKSRMHAQVLLEAHLIELTYTDYSSIGVNWSKFDLSLKGNFSNYANSANNLTPLGTSGPVYSFGMNFDPTGLINFLKTYGDVEVLSNPKILTLSNQPAVINVGEQLSYLYQNGSIASANTQTAATTTNTLGSVFIGLTLNIIPEVTEDGYIIMRINPVTSELLNDSQLGSSSQTTTTSTVRTLPPDTRVKQMTSIVKVKDSQKVLIGGLIERKTAKNNTKVPLIGNIPLFGRLFNNDSDTVRKSELFILITPTLIKQDVFPSIDDAILKRLN
jgi:general secretion pathway protein D